MTSSEPDQDYKRTREILDRAVARRPPKPKSGPPVPLTSKSFSQGLGEAIGKLVASQRLEIDGELAELRRRLDALEDVKR